MDKSRLAAEEIVKKYFDLPVMGRDGNDVQDLIDRVTSALTQASRDGYECGKKEKRYQIGFNEGHAIGFERGYQKAIEDAAKVAVEYETDSWNRGMLERIANEIRELKRS